MAQSVIWIASLGMMGEPFIPDNEEIHAHVPESMGCHFRAPMELQDAVAQSAI
jgi:hypothetical protein